MGCTASTRLCSTQAKDATQTCIAAYAVMAVESGNGARGWAKTLEFFSSSQAHRHPAILANTAKSGSHTLFIRTRPFLESQNNRFTCYNEPILYFRYHDRPGRSIRGYHLNQPNLTMPHSTGSCKHETQSRFLL